MINIIAFLYFGREFYYAFFPIFVIMLIFFFCQQAVSNTVCQTNLNNNETNICHYVEKVCVKHILFILHEKANKLKIKFKFYKRTRTYPTHKYTQLKE